jgi:hypothetical protein
MSILATLFYVFLWVASAFAQSFPGGFIETAGTGFRSKYTNAQMQALVPGVRSFFTFAAPYNTEAWRLTQADDCQNLDCVNYVGYSYWPNLNAHADSNEIQIFLGLAPARLGTGPTLFRVNKLTNAVTKVGPMFAVGSPYRNHTTESWYWSLSASRPNDIYLIEEPTRRRLMRYNVSTQVFTEVFSIVGRVSGCSTVSNCNRFLTQAHSDGTDTNHTASLWQSNPSPNPATPLGCVTFNSSTLVFRFYAKNGNYDECLLDKSGRWTTLLEDVNPNAAGCNTTNSCDDNDLVVFDNTTGLQVITFTGPVNTPGHSDTGYNALVTQDGHNNAASATIRWDYQLPTPTVGPLVHRSNDFFHPIMLHPSWTNAKAGVAFNRQYFCGSGADRTTFRNEITCARLDGSTDELIVAPVLTNLDSAGGCCAGDYSKLPKGNIDITGSYFIWTANLGTTRLDAFLVKVPSQLLVVKDVPPSAPTGVRAE